MNIDVEKIMKKLKKQKKKQSSSFLGAILFDLVGQIILFSFVIVGFMIYLYIKT